VSSDVPVRAPERSHTADVVTAWVLYVLQLGGEALLGMFWLMSVMAGDSCGSVEPGLRVCDGNYFVTWWFAYAGVLIGAVFVTPIAIIVAGRTGKWRWPWPVLAIVLLVAASVGYGFMLSR
jgi:hypothetical protein